MKSMHLWLACGIVSICCLCIIAFGIDVTSPAWVRYTLSIIWIASLIGLLTTPVLSLFLQWHAKRRLNRFYLAAFAFVAACYFICALLAINVKVYICTPDNYQHAWQCNVELKSLVVAGLLIPIVAFSGVQFIYGIIHVIKNIKRGRAV